MDATRRSNVKAARHAHEHAELRASDYPIEAFFEVAARCNLRCRMCAINYDTRYDARTGDAPFFEPHLFARLRPIFPSLLRAYLFGLGEPTLNEHLVDYIRELAAAGVEVWFNTNATLIDDAAAEALARAGAARITISVDGATARTFETIRRGAKFEAVARGIRALVAANRKYGRPRVDLSMVAMASNIAELPMMVDLCADLGAAALHVEPLYSQPSVAELVAHYAAENLGNVGTTRSLELFAQARERAQERGVDFQSRIIAEAGDVDYVKRRVSAEDDWNCSEPWSSIWVTTEGEVRTCCTNDVSFGSLYDNTIEEIWNGERFRAFRAQHARREIADGCANCIANSRRRHSPFFRTLRAATYRPLFDIAPAPGAAPVVIESPEAGSDVDEPLEVKGSIANPENAVEYELMIDETPVANFNDQAVTHLDGNSFSIRVAVPFLSDGAHTIWACRNADPARGWGYREVFFWR